MDRNKFYRIREELHRHPELSGQEKHTIQYIRQVLQEFQPSRIHPLERAMDWWQNTVSRAKV